MFAGVSAESGKERRIAWGEENLARGVEARQREGKVEAVGMVVLLTFVSAWSQY